MVHIYLAYRHQEQIPEYNPTSRQENYGVVIRRISAKKPVWRNKEIQTPPRNPQGRRIGCICVLLDAPLGQPSPRRTRKKIPYPTAAATRLKIIGPRHKPLGGHPSQANVPHL